MNLEVYKVNGQWNGREVFRLDDEHELVISTAFHGGPELKTVALGRTKRNGWFTHNPVLDYETALAISAPGITTIEHIQRQHRLALQNLDLVLKYAQAHYQLQEATA